MAVRPNLLGKLDRMAQSALAAYGRQLAEDEVRARQEALEVDRLERQYQIAEKRAKARAKELMAEYARSAEKIEGLVEQLFLEVNCLLAAGSGLARIFGSLGAISCSVAGLKRKVGDLIALSAWACFRSGQVGSLRILSSGYQPRAFAEPLCQAVEIAFQARFEPRSRRTNGVSEARQDRRAAGDGPAQDQAQPGTGNGGAARLQAPRGEPAGGGDDRGGDGGPGLLDEHST